MAHLKILEITELACIILVEGDIVVMLQSIYRPGPPSLNHLLKLLKGWFFGDSNILRSNKVPAMLSRNSESQLFGFKDYFPGAAGIGVKNFFLQILELACAI